MVDPKVLVGRKDADCADLATNVSDFADFKRAALHPDATLKEPCKGSPTAVNRVPADTPVTQNGVALPASADHTIAVGTEPANPRFGSVTLYSDTLGSIVRAENSGSARCARKTEDAASAWSGGSISR